MSHEITETDGAVFTGTKAWHGLGLTVSTAPTPNEALVLAGLDWLVEKFKGVTSTNGSETTYGSQYYPVVRMDNKDILSIQSEDYKIIQNHEIFELAYSLGETVKVESALSLGGGKKIICLIRIDSFAPKNSKHDEIVRYLALVSSHDGTTSLIALPTSIRIVCANTLKMALAMDEVKYRITHNGDMIRKKADMAKALERFATLGTFFEEKVNILSSRELDTASAKALFQQLYLTVTDESPAIWDASSVTSDEYEKYIKAKFTVDTWLSTFELNIESSDDAPHSVWEAVNVITGDIQHTPPKRGRTPLWTNNAYNNMFGVNQGKSLKVVNEALKIVC